MPIDSWLSLIDHLERTPHPVQCDIVACWVEPKSEVYRLKERIQSSKSLLFTTVIKESTWYQGSISFKCQKIQQVTLREMNLGDLPLQLSQCVTEVTLYNLTMSRGDLLHDLPLLEKVTLDLMNLSDLTLQLPPCVTEVTLVHVTTSVGVLLHDLLQLEKLTLEDVYLGDLPLQLPYSLTNIILTLVTMTIDSWLSLVDHLEHTPHPVLCDIVECYVEPISEVNRFIERVQSSKCLLFETVIKKSTWDQGRILFKCLTTPGQR